MHPFIKTSDEIIKMRAVCALAAELLEMIGAYVCSGIATDELDQICHDYIIYDQKAIPALLNYRGYPKTICTSVNNQICHGVPGSKKLKDGDILNVDVTIRKDDYHGDSSKMFIVGTPNILAERLVRVARECMFKGIEEVKPGARIGNIGAAIAEHANKNRFSVVREYCGHGIGRGIHEEPSILHFGTHGTGVAMEPGMIFTIEPMINAGKHFTKLMADGWTVVTKDHGLSAQWEHTVLVTETGYEILTLRNEEVNASRFG